MTKMAKPEIKYTQLFINNSFVDAVSGKTFATIDPATEEIICQIAEGDKVDVDKAVESAKKAFAFGSKWRTMDASVRGKLMFKLADLMETYADDIARLDTLDNGNDNKIRSYFACFAILLRNKYTHSEDRPYN